MKKLRIKDTAKKCLVTVLAVITVQISFGQVVDTASKEKDYTSTDEVKIGGIVPEIPILEIDHATNINRLSDFKSKLIILDFWYSGCTPCIQAFPKMQALQNEFDGKIQILLVNSLQTKKDTYAILESIEKLGEIVKITTLPTIYNAKEFIRYFPHNTVPHEVWIKDSRVIAITGAREVTSENIKKTLGVEANESSANQKANLVMKQDLLEYTPIKPLMLQIQNQIQSDIQFYSIILKNGPKGLRGPIYTYVTDSINNVSRITRQGLQSIISLYNQALTMNQAGGGTYYNLDGWDYGKRVILKVKDSTKYIGPNERLLKYYEDKDYYKWFSQNSFIYESVFPRVSMEKAFHENMLQDLNRYFNINGRVEKVRMKVLALVAKSHKFDKLKATLNSPILPSESLRYKQLIYNFPLQSFVMFLGKANRDQPLPIVDKTGYKGNVNLRIESNMNDLLALKKEIKEKYDLDLVEMMSEVDVMVIEENDYKPAK